eukprot:c27253_g1_i1 orf=2-157(-)
MHLSQHFQHRCKGKRCIQQHNLEDVSIYHVIMRPAMPSSQEVLDTALFPVFF